MLYKAISKLLRPKQVIELGRWNTDKNYLSMVKTIDFANHDNCGGDLCKYPIKYINKDNYNKVNKDDKDDKGDEYYLPFIL